MRDFSFPHVGAVVQDPMEMKNTVERNEALGIFSEAFKAKM